MGIFSAIGTALKNPDVQDRLAAIGATLQGDTNAAQAYQHRSAQRAAAEETAAKLEALAQAEAAGQLPQLVAPQLGNNLAALPADGPVNLPAPPAPISVSQLPPLPQRPADAMPAAPMAPPQMAPANPAPAVPARRSIYAEMLPQLIRASGRGADVSGLLSTLQAEDYIRSLPQKDQAAARAAGAGNFANWQREANKPVYNETTPGNTWGRYDPATGSYNPIYTAPQRAEPVTTERVIGSIVQKRAQGIDLTPAEQAVYDRWENGVGGEREPKAPGTSQIVGAVLAKVQQGGLESLTPGEKLIWDRYNRDDASAFAAAMAGGGAAAAAADDEEPAKPKPTAAAKPAAASKPTTRPRTLDAATVQRQFPGAQKAKDGFWYVRKGNQYFRVNP